MTSEKKAVFCSMAVVYSRLREESTHKREAINENIPNMGKKIIDTFAETLSRIIAPGQRFSSITELEKKSKVGKSTLSRARNRETATKIDNLEDIAGAYGLDAWQILVPGVDPREPPQLLGDAEKASQWPFPGVDENKVRSLSRTDQIRLDAAIQLAAAQLGIDITPSTDKRKEAI